MENPFKKFEDWYSTHRKVTKASLSGACCFTTIGKDGYPNSRFVSLKEIKSEAFVITGSLQSRKGLDVIHTPKVSLTFWWSETKKQVRVQGIAKELSEVESLEYFSNRSRESKVVSTVFEQGKEIKSFDELTTRFEEGLQKYESQELVKPQRWSGFYVKPIRMEFMEFKKTRLHKRIHFHKVQEGWEKTYLQP